jgi:cytochrome c553
LIYRKTRTAATIYTRTMYAYRRLPARLAVMWLGICAPLAPLAADTNTAPLLEKLLKLKADPAAVETMQAAGREKGAECARCHGENGISDMELVSNLAGQNPDYLLRQMNALASGARKHLSMGESLDRLSAAERESLALYYASFAVPGRVGDASSVARGALLYEKRCLSCHGRDAYGTATIPRLAGQRTDYLRWSIRNIQRGTPRRTPEMADAVRGLTGRDIADLADYLPTLP